MCSFLCYPFRARSHSRSIEILCSGAEIEMKVGARRAAALQTRGSTFHFEPFRARSLFSLSPLLTLKDELLKKNGQYLWPRDTVESRAIAAHSRLSFFLRVFYVHVELSFRSIPLGNR